MDKSAAISGNPFTSGFLAAGSLLIGVYCALFAALYHDSYAVMLSYWKGGDYSYCVVIPFIAGYTAWEKRRELGKIGSKPSWWGLVPLGAAVLLYFAGELGGEFYSLYISSWLLLVGVFWVHFGGRKIRAAGFSLGILPAMFPFPGFIYANVSVALQLLSSRLGVALIRAASIPVHREGNVIDLGYRKLEVVRACNGLRYLLPLMVLGVILAHFLKGSFARKAVLFLTTIPLAVGVNAFRIAALAIAGRKLSEGFAHAFSGWSVFMASMAVILAEMKLLEKTAKSAVKRPAASGGDKEGAGSGFKTQGLAEPTGGGRVGAGGKGWCGSFPKHPGPYVAVFLAAATLCFSMGLNTRELVPMRRPLSLFPWKIGQWAGSPVPMDPELLSGLHSSDCTIRSYTRTGGQPIELFIAYYASQRKGKSCHSPASCIPGSGWEFEQSGTASLKTPGYGRGDTRVSRAFVEKMGERRLVYYWFPQRGRILTNIFQLKLYAFWDTLREKRSDGAMVRLTTPVCASERVESADKRLEEFAGLIFPLLDRFVPGGRIDPSGERQ